MFGNPLRWVTAGMILLGSSAWAQDKTYDLRFNWKATKGHRAEIAELRHNTMKMKITANGQVVQEQASDTKFRYRYVREVLETRGTEIALARYAFTEAVHSDGQNPDTALPFEGKSVLCTVAEDGSCAWTYEGGEAVEEEHAAILTDHVHEGKKGGEKSGADMFAPPSPVRANESWTPDLQALADDMEMPIDAATSKGSMKLHAVENRAGSDWGKVEGALHLAVTSVGPMDLAETLPMTMKIDLQVCIDGSSPDGEMNMNMELKGARALRMPPGNPPADLELEVTGIGKKTVKTLN